MNTTLHLPSIPWLSFARFHAMLRPGMRAARPGAVPVDALDVLAGLDARTLHDIGAPDHLLARAVAYRDAQRRHDDLTQGIGAAGWRHW